MSKSNHREFCKWPAIPAGKSTGRDSLQQHGIPTPTRVGVAEASVTPSLKTLEKDQKSARALVSTNCESMECAPAGIAGKWLFRKTFF